MSNRLILGSRGNTGSKNPQLVKDNEGEVSVTGSALSFFVLCTGGYGNVGLKGEWAKKKLFYRTTMGGNTRPHIIISALITHKDYILKT